MKVNKRIEDLVEQIALDHHFTWHERMLEELEGKCACGELLVSHRAHAEHVARETQEAVRLILQEAITNLLPSPDSPVVGDDIYREGMQEALAIVTPPPRPAQLPHTELTEEALSELRSKLSSMSEE